MEKLPFPLYALDYSSQLIYSLKRKFPYVDKELIFDAAQESWLRLAISVNKIRKLDPKSIRAWLLATNSREIIYQLQRNKRKVSVEDIGNVLFQSYESDWDNRLSLHTILSNLAPREHEIIKLHDLDGWTLKEISLILDLPLTTIEKRHQRALKHLKISH